MMDKMMQTILMISNSTCKPGFISCECKAAIALFPDTDAQSDYDLIMTYYKSFNGLPISFYSIEIIVWIVLASWACYNKRTGGVTNVFIILMLLSAISEIAFYSLGDISFVSAALFEPLLTFLLFRIDVLLW